MKHIKFIALVIIMTFTVGCSDDILDKLPEDQISPEAYWKTPNDLALFLNQFYTSFPVHQGFNGGIFEFDNNSDNLADIFVNNRFVGNNATAPTTDGSWNYGSIRSVNFYLENCEKVQQGDASVINHYNGEAYFFRAMFYYNLLKRYGAVPYIDKTLNTDSPELYAPRMPRNELATKIVEDLDKAITKLKPKNSAEAFRVHQGMALSLKSSVCLYEGTWEKYHNGDAFAAPVNESEKFLQWAVEASEKLIDQGDYSLYNNGTSKTYWDLFNQINYAGNPEVMFWKKYSLSDGVTHSVGHYLPHTGSGSGVTKSLVDTYLAIDGQPISVSPLYSANQESSLTSIVKDRDPRLAQTIATPGDLLTVNSGVPDEIFQFPVFRGNNEITNTTGFQIYKGGTTDKAQRYDSYTGAIIYRYAEVLLNFAEAKAELGSLTQGDLDKSINLLRARVGMPALSISPVADPNKAFPGLSDLINEVRRERRVETALEGKRFDDLMRWAAADELIVGKRWLGFKIIGSDIQSEFSDLIGKSLLVNPAGHIDPYMNTIPGGFGFKIGRDYLNPLPTEEIILSKGSLIQNPGWE